MFLWGHSTVDHLRMPQMRKARILGRKKGVVTTRRLGWSICPLLHFSSSYPLSSGRYVKASSSSIIIWTDTQGTSLTKRSFLFAHSPEHGRKEQPRLLTGGIYGSLELLMRKRVHKTLGQDNELPFMKLSIMDTTALPGTPQMQIWSPEFELGCQTSTSWWAMF